MNSIYKNITIENFRELLFSYENSEKVFWEADKNKLIHPGEYGKYREDIVNRFLGLYIPEQFGISSGFVINSSGEISTQCDVIIYDKARTPKVQNHENQRFFPIETVLGVGEVKSNIGSMKELNQHLAKLSAFKKLRLSVRDPVPYKRGTLKAPFNPSEIFSDNIFTFLICYKFDFELKLEKIDYVDVERKLWHNMILSLKDGLLTYRTNKTKNLYFPFLKNTELDFWFLPSDNNELPSAITAFLSALSFFINNTTLLELHSESYLFPPEKLVDKIE